MEITQTTIEPYLKALDPQRKKEVELVIQLFKKVTQREPNLWGTIVGFGKLYYRYQTGHDGYMPIIGFASRKTMITFYLSLDIAQYPQLKSLGKFKIGKSCLYVKRLTDLHWPTFVNLVEQSFRDALALPFVKLVN